jgi:hypothetical protein
LIGETSQATGTYGFHSFARDDSSGTHAVEAPFIRVDEAVRMALTPAPANGADEGGGVVAAGTGREVLAGSPHRVQSGVSAIPVVNAPPKLSPLVSAATFHALQEWEGHVLEINEDEFVAALVDLTAGSSDEGEEAIIPLTEIADDDAAALRVGGIFRWVIGYERSRSGTKKRVSQIVFRDLPRITERDLQQGREWARETRRAFKL